MEHQASTTKLSFMWLVRIRWAAFLVLGLVVVIAPPALHLKLPTVLLLGIVLLAAGLNVGCLAWARARRDVPERALWAPLAADFLALTALLYLTGGSHNPFVAAYLPLVVLGATLLGRRAAWAVAFASAVSVCVLTVVYVPLTLDHDHGHAGDGNHHAGDHDGAAHDSPDGDHHDGDHDDGDHHDGDHHSAGGEHPHGANPSEHVVAHVQTVWVAFPILAALIAYLVSSALRQRDLQLIAQRARRARAEHLAELGVMAASAAHDLGSPLSTIAVITKDLERALDQQLPIDASDVRMIRTQVDRCRETLEELARHARAMDTETVPRCSLGAILDEVMARSDDGVSVEVSVDREHRETEVRAPARAVGYVLRAIVDNALEASRPGSTVTVGAERRAGSCRILVDDAGEGMSDEALARAGSRPFGPESRRGLGVGLFLSRAVMESVGGSIEVERRLPSGTRVSLTLPLVGAKEET